MFKNNNLTKMNKGFRFTQIITAALQAFTHGTNDAQKAMGIITMALIANGYLRQTRFLFGYNYRVPLQWVLVHLSVVGRLLKQLVETS